jgi:hypothetical protein
MHRSTRCAWIKQNDADATTFTPFLCGAAAVQMILYGRDDDRFRPPLRKALRDSAAQLRTDQNFVWAEIIQHSQSTPLPAGGHYDGAPPSSQICEPGGPCWAAYPHALARTISAGVTIGSGRVAGVSVRVRSFADDSDLPNAIVDSLDRGVVAAMLSDGTHWLVVYGYRELDDDAFELYYRDGQVGKGSVTFWGSDEFFAVADTVNTGVFGGKHVLVTASPTVPILRHAIGLPSPRQMMGPQRRLSGPKVEFGGGDATRLHADLMADPEWSRTFDRASIGRILSVKNGMANGTDYYLVDFVAAGSNAADRKIRRVGSVMVDAYTLRRRRTIGVEHPDEELPPLLTTAEELTPYVERLNIPNANVDRELVWLPSDQSPSPFKPFHAVLDPSRTGPAAFIRVDGATFTQLTFSLAGI